MIQFQKTNDKGDRLKAYTHKGYLSSEYSSTVEKVQKRNQTIVGVIFYGTSIASYWALNNVPKLNHLIQSKLAWKGRFLAASALVGFVNSVVASLFLVRSIRNTHEQLLKKQVFPAWFNRDKVVNPDRIFFELDDNRNNEPTIWHSGLTLSSIERLVPDFIVGNPLKPHPPVAEVHHH